VASRWRWSQTLTETDPVVRTSVWVVKTRVWVVRSRDQVAEISVPVIRIWAPAGVHWVLEEETSGQRTPVYLEVD